MIVLSESSSRLEQTPSARELYAATETAKLSGCLVYYIPQDFDDFDDPTDAFAHIPKQPSLSPGIWNGYIPSAEHYETVYQLALSKNIRLLNTYEEHLRAQEFDRAYPHIEELTAKSVIVTHPDQCSEAAEKVGLPVFVKGTVQSRKQRGWKTCMAETLGELRQLTEAYLSLEGRTRGRVIGRELLPLRYENSAPNGFPIGREYRVFLYNYEVIGFGYYWDGDDPLKVLAPAEKQAVLILAIEASKRMAVPFIAVDIGQLIDARWIVIETGDAQFSSTSQIPLLPIWNKISRIV